MSNNLRPISTLLLSVILLCLSLVIAPAAQASIPTPFRGIDAPTLVHFHDHIRHLLWHESHASSHAVESSLSNLRTIVIDPGHGGMDSGAISIAHVYEKHLTLELAYLLREQLQQRFPKANIILTRYWDKPLTLHDRMHTANMLEADLFVSLHYNSAPHDRAVGFETYFISPEPITPYNHDDRTIAHTESPDNITDNTSDLQPSYSDAHRPQDLLAVIKHDLKRNLLHQHSGRFAEIIQAQLRRHLPNTPDRGVKQANFGVLRGALMPAVIVEGGFLSHPHEGMKAIELAHREHIVRALVEAIEDFDQYLSKIP